MKEADGLGGFEYWYYLHAAKNSVEDGAPVELEPNDSTAEAHSLDVGEHSFWARLYPSTDSDVYVVEAEAGDQLTVTFSRIGDDEPTSVDFALTSVSGGKVVAGLWDGEEEPVFDGTLDAGTHHLTITSQDPSVISMANHYYRVDVNFTRP